MYKTFRVKNFRCFKDLQINDLGRVNLIAGKNNSGKTALLEAMYLLTKPLTASVLLDLQIARGLEAPAISSANYNRQFFFRYDSSAAIEIESECNALPDKGRKLEISEIKNTSQHSYAFHNHFNDLVRGGLPRVEAAARIDQIDSCLYLQFKSETGTGYSMELFTDRPANSQREVENPSNYIPVQGRPDNDTVVADFSNLDRTGKLSILQNTLKHFEQELSDLRLSQPYGELLICGRMNGYLIPLKLMGEGVNRASHILLTMISNEESLLLIDEIENGIHFSVQKDFWKAIGRAAREEDIQVFATTHSLEMIRAAYEAFSEENKLDEFRYHRLDRDRDTGDIEAVTYNELDMNAVAAFDFEHEVR